MIKLLKKHKYKLLTLMLSIVSIFTLFLSINKTYAYESDNFTYTTTLYTDNTYTNELQLTTNNNIENSLLVNNNDIFYFDIDNMPNNFNFAGYYFLINFYYFNDNNEIASATNNVVFRFTYGQNNNVGDLTYTPRTIRQFDNYYTAIMQFNTNIMYYYDNHCKMQFISSAQVSNGYVVIKNFDIVKPSDIGLSQYYDTYYGQIEDNYNALLSDYNDLQYNYDSLQSQYTSLQNQLNSLQTTYDNLMLAYNALESDYDTLQANYRTLNANWNDLYDRYEQLESDYNNLQNTLDNLPNYNGIQSFIDSFNGATLELTGYAGLGPISGSPTYTLNNFENSNFNLSRDTDTFYTWIQNNINTYGGFDLYITLSVPYTTSLSVSFSNTDYNHTIAIYSQIDGLSVASYSDYENQSVIVVNENNNYSIIQISVSLTQSDYDFILSSNIYGDQYMNGYNNGYNQSLREWNSELNTARNTIESQKQTIRTLQAQLNTANQYDLNKLMWTIASTPFESFKQIWNVEFFGVNISTMITGFITGIIVLWIIKKFFL